MLLGECYSVKNSGIWIHVNERLNLLTRFLNDWDKKTLAYRLEIVPHEKFLAACTFCFLVDKVN